jgi:hypothetical protein
MFEGYSTFFVGKRGTERRRRKNFFWNGIDIVNGGID